MSLTSALNTAQAIFRNTGEQTSVVSTNIANDGNANYVRRSAVVTNTIYGASTVVNERSQQMALLRQLTGAASASSAQDTLLEGLTTLSNALGGNDYELSPSTYLAELQNSLEAFAASPGEFTLGATVVTDAQDLANSLNTTSAAVQKLRGDSDAEIVTQVSDLNRLLSEFQVVNDAVVKATATGGDPSDALDTRDTLLKDISQIIGIDASTRANGDMVIYTSEGTTLFETVPRTVTFTRTLAYDATVTGNSVFVDGVAIEPGQGGNTDGDGSLSALLQLRDEIAPTFQTQLDEVARGLIEAFAETDPLGVAADMPGLFTWSGGTSLTSGVVEPGLAGSITVSSSVITSAGGNPMLLRDGGINGATYEWNTGGNSGYTTLLLGYSDALDADRAFDATADLKTSMSVMTFASGSIGWLEDLRSNATTASDNKVALYDRSFQTYSSETGVNLDEELSLLLDVEQSYKASAKLVSTVDAMLQAVLDMAG
ncbi:MULTISPECIES: flagellar hook-associated protein FlgK [Alphaproteobacteria]|uniref:Flagellar hook-associated protein 1 n=2 Tax=Alphaproteobacteria TaxID=28211 RepID=A0A512HIM9_9HYPH|nr:MULTISPECIES: flagellar hook-associated protein FlgK [Alphaproteobacteria]GEO85240.1 flagellar hook protein FlgK [Ciceribacter naphthalenivorans]GLR24426.1 flagellar hook protein FlgK [Ciceribacter naphthalenivorans]GLT07282.1 flagellar hook protein FlgK [Sphingomonas psychrolutea]